MPRDSYLDTRAWVESLPLHPLAANGANAYTAAALGLRIASALRAAGAAEYLAQRIGDDATRAVLRGTRLHGEAR